MTGIGEIIGSGRLSPETELSKSMPRGKALVTVRLSQSMASDSLHSDVDVDHAFSGQLR